MTSQLPGSLKMMQGNRRVNYYARCKNSPSGLTWAGWNRRNGSLTLIENNISKKIPPMAGLLTGV